MSVVVCADFSLSESYCNSPSWWDYLLSRSMSQASRLPTRILWQRRHTAVQSQALRKQRTIALCFLCVHHLSSVQVWITLLVSSLQHWHLHRESFVWKAGKGRPLMSESIFSCGTFLSHSFYNGLHVCSEASFRCSGWEQEHYLINFCISHVCQATGPQIPVKQIARKENDHKRWYMNSLFIDS